MIAYDRCERKRVRAALRRRVAAHEAYVRGAAGGDSRRIWVYASVYAAGRGVVLSDGGGVYAEKGGGVMQEEGYSGMFYVMLLLGIIGVVGFFAVAAGAAGGM